MHQDIFLNPGEIKNAQDQKTVYISLILHIIQNLQVIFHHYHQVVSIANPHFAVLHYSTNLNWSIKICFHYVRLLARKQPVSEWISFMKGWKLQFCPRNTLLYFRPPCILHAFMNLSSIKILHLCCVLRIGIICHSMLDDIKNQMADAVITTIVTAVL